MSKEALLGDTELLGQILKYRVIANHRIFAFEIIVDELRLLSNSLF